MMMMMTEALNTLVRHGHKVTQTKYE